ncbi:MAG: IS982 family transposase [Actinobacteria bacterium]|nr:IS982 family transposase [Actinomycetota bacterium]
MTASLETLVVAAYIFADGVAIPRPGPQGKISDAELIALGVAQAAIGIPSDRQFLGLVGKLLPGWFPHLPEQSQYNRRLRRLAPSIASVQLRISALLASGKLRLADGTLIGVANYAGCQSRSAFAGTAAYGYCAAKSQYVWGMRLVLLTDSIGVPVGYTLVAANEKEYEPVRELTTSQAGCTLIADKGYWGREYAETLALQGVKIRTPERTRSASNLEQEQRLARLRLVIESTISNLKCQMRLEQHLAKTPRGLVQRIAQRLLALTLGMLINTLSARPARALVAYDGR